MGQYFITEELLVLVLGFLHAHEVLLLGKARLTRLLWVLLLESSN